MCFLPTILFYCFHKLCCLIQRFPSIIFYINQLGETAGLLTTRSPLSPVPEWRLQLLLLFLSPYWGICRRQIVFKVWIDIDPCACDATPVQRRVILTIPYVRQFAILKVKSWYRHALRIIGPLLGGIYLLLVGSPHTESVNREAIRPR